MDAVLWGFAIVLLVNAFACLYRAYAGPTVVDRILAINIVGTTTLIVLALLAALSHRTMLLDVALIYGLLNFVLAVAASRFIEGGRLRGDWK